MRRVERVIAVLGATSVGKSALTLRFVKDEFSSEYDPTIFKNYRHQLTTRDGIEYDLNLYDTAGLEPQPQLTEKYINSNGFILVYSIADRQSFDVVNQIYQELRDELNKISIPIVLIANKVDLNEKRCISYEEGKRLADKMQAKFYETSALKGDNVKDGFISLLNIIDNRNTNNNNNNNHVSGVNSTASMGNHANNHTNHVNNNNNTNTNNTNNRGGGNQQINNNRPGNANQMDNNNNNRNQRCIIC